MQQDIAVLDYSELVAIIKQYGNRRLQTDMGIAGKNSCFKKCFTEHTLQLKTSHKPSVAMMSTSSSDTRSMTVTYIHAGRTKASMGQHLKRITAW